jgi:glycosyltransferase involved in cell wall biosynthesis
MADGRDPLCVACAARLVPEKGIDVLLRAWHRVVSHVPQARLEIAGDGPARAKLHRLVADLGIGDSVRFSGWLRPEGMSELFSRASIVVLPSRWEEGLGMVLVEGGLSGCALIGSDLGGIRDIIEPEETGLVFPAEDADALEAALVRCLRDAALTRRLGVAAQARAERYLARRDRQLDRLRIAVESLRVGTTSGSPPGGTA